MPTIALINQKGGVGKTTSTINLGAGLAMLGKSVLLVDLDPQAHLTYGLGIQAHDLVYTVYEVLKGDVAAQEAILQRDALEVLPSSLGLSAA